MFLYPTLGFLYYFKSISVPSIPNFGKDFVLIDLFSLGYFIN